MDFNELKKQIKKHVPELIFFSISKFDINNEQNNNNNRHSNQITISNTSVKYKHDSIVLDFLNKYK
jgi:hypothetical protein